MDVFLRYNLICEVLTTTTTTTVGLVIEARDPCFVRKQRYLLFNAKVLNLVTR